MKKIILFLFVLQLCFAASVYAETDKITGMPDYSAEIVKEQTAQQNIDNIGYKILNANKIDKRMMFLYKDTDIKRLKELYKIPELTKRQVIVYRNEIKFASNDDEIAAMLSRDICAVNETYFGQFKGLIGAAQIKLAPKKFEIYFDKRGVDYMVNAGFNPLGMITYINKSCPQKRYDKIGRANLTSKRLANIYEYIFVKYPYFLKNNEYLDNEAYQNFLLTSRENRLKLQKKIKSGKNGKVNYE